MAKDTIEISSLQEGESRILTKNGNGYTVVPLTASSGGSIQWEKM